MLLPEFFGGSGVCSQDFVPPTEARAGVLSRMCCLGLGFRGAELHRGGPIAQMGVSQI